MTTTVVAVDFGASSIRVCRVDLDARPLVPEVVHRHEHAPVSHPDGSLRWDWARLVTEMRIGLDRAASIGAVASIGIDTWGVDYGLLDERGALIAPPFSYRDSRTSGWKDVVERIGTRRLYELSGLQLMPINTLFQLSAHPPEERARARALLMLPELLVHELCGEAVAEATSAGTTALVDIGTGDWSEELIEAAGAERRWFQPIRSACALAGHWRGVPIHLVGGHDTASAVVAMGTRPSQGTAFVSAGTWFLVGCERDAPDTSVEAQAANFSNERGTFGGIRFLKNLTGMWLFEGCRKSWRDPPIDALFEAAAAVADVPALVDPDHPDLAAPDDMLSAICGVAGIPVETSPAVVVRLIVESIAEGVRRIVDTLPEVRDVTLFGGATRSVLLRQSIEARTGRAVRVGPAEATALGNALTQGIALGRVADLAEARCALEDAASG